MISLDEIRSMVAAQLDWPVADIGDHDDLIKMGLNSIRIMAMAGRWRQGGAGITFAELAASPTVDSWHALLNAAEGNGGADPLASRTEPVVDDAPFPLAPMQHAYWVGRSDGQELGGVAAHLYVEFDGLDIDPARLQRAVSDLVAAHPMLRTRFLPDGTQQTLPEPARPVFSVVDLRGQTGDQTEAALAELRDRKTHQRLEIELGRVIDVTLTRCDGGLCRLHLDVDMLAADAMSYRVLVSDLAELYGGGRRCRRPGTATAAIAPRSAGAAPPGSANGNGGSSGYRTCPAPPNCRPFRVGQAGRPAQSATITGWHQKPSRRWWPAPTNAASPRRWRWPRSSPTPSAAGRRRTDFCSMCRCSTVNRCTRTSTG